METGFLSNENFSNVFKKHDVIHKKDLHLDDRQLYYYHCELNEQPEIEAELYSKLPNMSYGNESSKLSSNIVQFG